MDDDILFSGEGPCDEFLRAVRKVAFGQGKHEDPEWIAGYVSTCFVGKALRWYEELDENTQDDWKQLRKALLERFPPVSEDYPQPISESSSSSNPMNHRPTTLATPPAESLRFESAIRIHGTVPTSPPISTAAAHHLLTPPSAPPIQALRTGKGTRPLPKIPEAAPPLISPFSGVFNAPDSQPSAPIRGRLAVTYASGSAINRGYVAKSRIRGYYEITEDPSQALRVDCTPTGQPLDFRILDSLPEGDFDRLGMVWHDAEPKVEALSVQYALCVAVEGPSIIRRLSCDCAHRGPVGTTVWSLRDDGSIDPVWKTGKQNYYSLQAAVYCERPTKRLLFVADWNVYVGRGLLRFYNKARIFFEPI